MRKLSSLRLTGGLVALVALTLASCSDGDAHLVSARVARDRAELIGGPAALADVGDILLENDQVRFAFLTGTHSVGPGVFGGSLVDADLRRKEDRFREGNGLDQFGEMFPVINLSVPEPGHTDDDECTLMPDRVAVAEAGTSAKCPWDSGIPGDARRCAAVRVRGCAGALLALIGVLQLDIGKPVFETLYILREGDRHLEMVTTYELKGAGAVSAQVAPLDPITQPTSLIGTLLGDNSGDPAYMGRQKGVIGGDFTIFGKKLSLFAPGVGFDEDSNIIDRIFTGEDTLRTPAVFDYMGGIGKGVSYALFSKEDVESKVAIPFFTGSITFVLTHAKTCPGGDTACQEALHRGTFRRYFVVGEGDIGSLLEGIFKVRGTAHGSVKGAVIDRRTGKPISHADVFAFSDPLARAGSDRAECNALRAAQGQVAFSALLTCASATAPAEKPDDLGIVSHMQTDRGTDTVLDGDFAGPLLPGRYWLVARTTSRLPSEAVLVQVDAGRTTEAAIGLAEAGRVVFDIHDESGERGPAKLTFVGQPCQVLPTKPGRACAAGEQGCIETEERCDPITSTFGPKRLYFGDSRTPDGISEIARTLEGIGEVQIEPGIYRVRVSRGIEYSIEDRIIDVSAGSSVQLDAVLQRLVDTRGWVSADFHVHASPSFDSGVPLRDRVTSFITDGVELLSSSDHDVVTDYAPLVRELGVEQLLGTQVGLETTTLEIGHFIGFPLQVDVTRPAGGAFDWVDKRPADIFKGIRTLTRTPGGAGPPGGLPANPGDRPMGGGGMGGAGMGGAGGAGGAGMPGPTSVIIVPHPRDGFFGYFDQYGLDPITLAQDSGRVAALSNNNILISGWDDGYDAIEIINGKRWDFLRTPSVGEIADYNAAVSEIRARSLSAHDKRVLQDEAAARHVKRVIVRTPEEQRALRFDRDSQVVCAADEDCDKLPDAASYPKCNPHTLTCYRPGKTCTAGSTMSGCDPGEVCDGGAIPAACVAPCTSSEQCRPDEFCNLGAGVPAEIRGLCIKSSCDGAQSTLAGEGDRPCAPVIRGVVDDWFRMLNYDVRKIGLGNSDTHDIDGIEPGSPRNYVCSSTDDPRLIDPQEIADQVRKGCVFTTYGPFVEFTVDGQPLGSMVKPTRPDGAVELHVRVQTPGWFDVTRMEVYRNGDLLRTCTAGSDDQCPEAAVRLAVPNKGPLVLDLKFTDKPTRDAWYVVIVTGDGQDPASTMPGTAARSISPVQTSTELPNLAIGELLKVALKDAKLFGGVMASSVLGPLTLVPQVTQTQPYAITNPIRVDIEGNGFQGSGGRKLPWHQAAPSTQSLVGHPLSRLGESERGQSLLRAAMRTLRRLELNASHGRHR